MSAKLFDCWIVRAPEPPWFSVGQLLPPPENVLALLLVMVIVAVEAETVRPATAVFAFQLVPVTVQTPLPSVSVLVPEVKAKEPSDTFLPLASNVPAVSVSARVEARVRLSASWKVPPAPAINKGELKVTPFVVIVYGPVVPAI